MRINNDGGISIIEHRGMHASIFFFPSSLVDITRA